MNHPSDEELEAMVASPEGQAAQAAWQEFRAKWGEFVKAHPLPDGR